MIPSHAAIFGPKKLESDAMTLPVPTTPNGLRPPVPGPEYAPDVRPTVSTPEHISPPDMHPTESTLAPTIGMRGLEKFVEDVSTDTAAIDAATATISTREDQTKSESTNVPLMQAITLASSV